MVLLAIFTARAIFLGSSSISTTSAASLAASLPSPPIASAPIDKAQELMNLVYEKITAPGKSYEDFKEELLW